MEAKVGWKSCSYRWTDAKAAESQKKLRLLLTSIVEI